MYAAGKNPQLLTNLASDVKPGDVARLARLLGRPLGRSATWILQIAIDDPKAYSNLGMSPPKSTFWRSTTLIEYVGETNDKAPGHRVGKINW